MGRRERPAGLAASRSAPAGPATRRRSGWLTWAVSLLGRPAGPGAEAVGGPRVTLVTVSQTAGAAERARQVLEAGGCAVTVRWLREAADRAPADLTGGEVCHGLLRLAVTELLAGRSLIGDWPGPWAVPQVVVPGGLDYRRVEVHADLPDHYRRRPLYQPEMGVLFVRTTVEESQELGRRLAGALNAARAPVAVLWPHRGLSALDQPEGVFWWPEADAALYSALRGHLRPDIPVYELDHNINDTAFAETAAGVLLELLRRTRRR